MAYDFTLTRIDNTDTFKEWADKCNAIIDGLNATDFVTNTEGIMTLASNQTVTGIKTFSQSTNFSGSVLITGDYSFGGTTGTISTSTLNISSGSSTTGDGIQLIGAKGIGFKSSASSNAASLKFENAGTPEKLQFNYAGSETGIFEIATGNKLALAGTSPVLTVNNYDWNLPGTSPGTTASLLRWSGGGSPDVEWFAQSTLEGNIATSVRSLLQAENFTLPVNLIPVGTMIAVDARILDSWATEGSPAEFTKWDGAPGWLPCDGQTISYDENASPADITYKEIVELLEGLNSPSVSGSTTLPDTIGSPSDEDPIGGNAIVYLIKYKSDDATAFAVSSVTGASGADGVQLYNSAGAAVSSFDITGGKIGLNIDTADFTFGSGGELSLTADIDTTATANTIAKRDSTGALAVGEPTADDHAATKAFVDKVVGERGSTISFPELMDGHQSFADKELSLSLVGRGGRGLATGINRFERHGERISEGTMVANRGFNTFSPVTDQDAIFKRTICTANNFFFIDNDDIIYGTGRNAEGQIGQKDRGTTGDFETFYTQYHQSGQQPYNDDFVELPVPALLPQKSEWSANAVTVDTVAYSNSADNPTIVVKTKDGIGNEYESGSRTQGLEKYETDSSVPYTRGWLIGSSDNTYGSIGLGTNFSGEIVTTTSNGHNRGTAITLGAATSVLSEGILIPGGRRKILVGGQEVRQVFTAAQMNQGPNNFNIQNNTNTVQYYAFLDEDDSGGPEPGNAYKFYIFAVAPISITNVRTGGSIRPQIGFRRDNDGVFDYFAMTLTSRASSFTPIVRVPTAKSSVERDLPAIAKLVYFAQEETDDDGEEGEKFPFDYNDKIILQGLQESTFEMGSSENIVPATNARTSYTTSGPRVFGIQGAGASLWATFGATDTERESGISAALAADTTFKDKINKRFHYYKRNATLAGGLGVDDSAALAQWKTNLGFSGSETFNQFSYYVKKSAVSERGSWLIVGKPGNESDNELWFAGSSATGQSGNGDTSGAITRHVPVVFGSTSVAGGSITQQSSGVFKKSTDHGYEDFERLEVRNKFYYIVRGDTQNRNLSNRFRLFESASDAFDAIIEKDPNSSGIAAANSNKYADDAITEAVIRHYPKLKGVFDISIGTSSIESAHDYVLVRRTTDTTSDTNQLDALAESSLASDKINVLGFGSNRQRQLTASGDQKVFPISIQLNTTDKPVDIIAISNSNVSFVVTENTSTAARTLKVAGDSSTGLTDTGVITGNTGGFISSETLSSSWSVSKVFAQAGVNSTNLSTVFIVAESKTTAGNYALFAAGKNLKERFGTPHGVDNTGVAVAIDNYIRVPFPEDPSNIVSIQGIQGTSGPATFALCKTPESGETAEEFSAKPGRVYGAGLSKHYFGNESSAITHTWHQIDGQIVST